MLFNLDVSFKMLSGGTVTLYIFFLQKPWINTKAIRVFLPFKIKGMSQALEKKWFLKEEH